MPGAAVSAHTFGWTTAKLWSDHQSSLGIDVADFFLFSFILLQLSTIIWPGHNDMNYLPLLYSTFSPYQKLYLLILTCWSRWCACIHFRGGGNCEINFRVTGDSDRIAIRNTYAECVPKITIIINLLITWTCDARRHDARLSPNFSFSFQCIIIMINYGFIFIFNNNKRMQNDRLTAQVEKWTQKFACTPLATVSIQTFMIIFEEKYKKNVHFTVLCGVKPQKYYFLIAHYLIDSFCFVVVHSTCRNFTSICITCIHKNFHYDGAEHPKFAVAAAAAVRHWWECVFSECMQSETMFKSVLWARPTKMHPRPIAVVNSFTDHH